MLEFIFGWILGVWMGQQLPLPSVQMHIETWWNRPKTVQNDTVSEIDKEEEEVPLFSGEMPATP